jgi:hypothetical protein
MNYVDFLLNNDEALSDYLKGWSETHYTAEEYYRNVYINQKHKSKIKRFLIKIGVLKDEYI